ncbi:MAG: shikimate dehydrogenase [Planctomycetaceae bacterium]|nr:shikimate dehydrogenase [Planctomycetaceae bacterium]MCP4461558.1 shikimate dehydrogenase [Planctomycetaceae bacterium]MDG1806636.1 shikimate dehydrogenase [Pirellulaceae bacterium]MDG2103675.1 shikimate dehydrogenase [Pirellulaceae bacterium]
MICVSIGRGRHRMMMAEHKHLAETGTELVELRLDYIRRSVNLRRLLAERHCPVIATCRRPHERGKWMRSEEDRLVLLRTAIANGADYIDLESDIAGKIPRYGDTKRIVSYHNFHETPHDLDSIYEMMCRLDPDIIKIATMANNPIDNIRVLRLCKNKKFPTVAFCMGDMGLPSRVLCGKFGAPFTYATFNTERIMAPGQLTQEQLIRDYNYEKLTQNTKILGVIADPVAHSLSPQIHNACLAKEALDMLYLPFRVPSEYLDEFMQHALELDLVGLSVTLPHKQAILKHVSALDDLSAGIKAANTVVFRGQGTMGFNTDCAAALASLREALAENRETPSFDGLRVLILGAGGVARTIGFGLHREGAKVSICTRDYRKGEALATALQCKTTDWAGRANAEYDVLINATPVGMHPNLDESPMEAKWFAKRAIVFDTVYNPEQTLFIKHARAAGCITITGVDMFARQAHQQFKLFTGKDTDLDLIRNVIKKSISAAKY